MIIFIVLIILAPLLLVSHLTNPFNRLSVIKLPFRIRSLQPLQVKDQTAQLRVHNGRFWRWLAVAECGVYILHTRYGGSRRAKAETVEGIIESIHKLRFRPDRLLLISGDHFNGLFVRNLGVFYYPMLDTRISGSAEDWQARQISYAQSLVYGLAVFRERTIPTTTIVSSGPYSATCVNFYAYPSDTVYGLLYALSALLGQEPACLNDYAKPQHELSTRLLGEQLLAAYGTTLRQLYEHYQKTVFDVETGLLRTAVHLSGAKDITRRESAFYDNVVYWKTTRLAMRLGLIPNNQPSLKQLKQRILKTFWLPEKGYFLEDLSAEGQAKAYYSSDWLIVLATGFLTVKDAKERVYVRRCMEHIQKQHIDQPLPLKYHADRRAHRQFTAVRWAVAAYGGDAIWSFWGMEYIKCLLLLYESTGESAWLERADKHIKSHKQTMLNVKGFPEVLDNRRRLLQTPFYRGIRQTGWVIGFEQVLAMRQNLKNQ